MNILGKLFGKQSEQDDRLAILAVELGLAGGEVLRRDFGFTEEQVTRWLDAMLDRAKTNRALVAAHDRDSAYQIAQVYAFQGELDAAFEWLERAFDVRDPGLTEMKVDPLLAKAREDPWYREMLERMGLAG